MDKKILVTGPTDSETKIELTLNSNTLHVETSKDLSAKDLFEFLDFEREAKYTVERGDKGKVRPEVFNSFCKLLEDIAKKLSGIQVGRDASDDPDDLDEVDQAVVERD